MKQKWSRSWVGSRQPRKQRKYRHKAPMHVRRAFVSAHLAPELRRRFSTRAVPVRKGDEIEVMVGTLRGLKGLVERVDLKNCKIYADGIKAKKVDGSEVPKPLEPSNLRLTRLNLDDKMRLKSLDRKKEEPKAEKKPKKGRRFALPKKPAKKEEPKKETKKKAVKPAAKRK